MSFPGERKVLAKQHKYKVREIDLVLR